MKNILLVFLGGGAGSVLRFLISRNLPDTVFPLGTFTVNIIGCLLIGFILGTGQKHDLFSPGTTLLLATGFCGGFTTFSSFALENLELLRSGDWSGFAVYTLLSIILGTAAVFAGLFLTGYFRA